MVWDFNGILSDVTRRREHALLYIESTGQKIRKERYDELRGKASRLGPYTADGKAQYRFGSKLDLTRAGEHWEQERALTAGYVTQALKAGDVKAAVEALNEAELLNGGLTRAYNRLIHFAKRNGENRQRVDEELARNRAERDIGGYERWVSHEITQEDIDANRKIGMESFGNYNAENYKKPELALRDFVVSAIAVGDPLNRAMVEGILEAAEESGQSDIATSLQRVLAQTA